MQIIVSHLQLFKRMADAFGPTIPDVEFVFGTSDSPFMLRQVRARETDPINLRIAVHLRTLHQVASFEALRGGRRGNGYEWLKPSAAFGVRTQP